MGLLFTVATTIIATSVAQAATLTVVDGKILGATDVDVGGMFFDVEFFDGSCDTIFGSCDISTPSAFSTRAQVLEANAALLTQVFESVQFPAIPTLPTGCELPGAYSGFNCFVNTPYFPDNLIISIAVICVFPSGGGIDCAYNEGNTAEGSLGDGAAPTFGGLSDSTWAVWSSVNPVPVPAAIWLFGSGLIGLIGIARRKKA